ncbi:Mcp5-PH multi-domain protein [Pyrenophora teres f. maculata]|nr:Mcp5-PH multi-domain protein [Pyrenophora teres f. maculata]
MSTDYFSDQEYTSNQPLPTPAGTPYSSLSRRNSRYDGPGSDVASSPPPLPPDPCFTSSDDFANDENISILDPRRFTPTLHANLVSEILNLRRELDSKHRFIDDLESNLQATRTDNDALTKQLSAAAKENKQVKRQLQHFENETLAALEEIAEERDKSKAVNADLREKLAAAEKRTRTQDDDSTKVHDMWAREKDQWAGEKRVLERRVHVSETRLKMLLEEIAAHEAANEEAGLISDADDQAADNVPESDAGSIRSSPQRSPQRRSSTRLTRHSRNQSNSSYKSIGRNYRMSLLSFDGHNRGNGISLADELIFDEVDEEEEELLDLELDSDDFPENEMRARRQLESRQSTMLPDEKAKRILGLSSEPQQFSPTIMEENEPRKQSHETGKSSVTLTQREINLIWPPTRPIYIDTGVQPSPPASPTKPTFVEAACQTVEPPAQAKSNDVPSTAAEIEANQSRKRVSVPLNASPLSQANAGTSMMTSSSVQTVDRPLSPPPTPKIPVPSETSEFPQTELVSIATQTDAPPEPKPELPKRASPPAPITIPSIAIHAPTSAPSSPRAPILPPCTKTVSTQTSGDLIVTMRSASMQTEPIRIDQRPVKLPAHLLPSAISSNPGTPETKGKKDLDNSPVSDTEKSTLATSARQDLMSRLVEKAGGTKIENRYPGNNDNGPLSRKLHADILSRPFRTSSLFAGFDGPSSDEEEDDGELSDGDYRGSQFSTPMLSSRNAKSGRPVNPPTPVPEDKEPMPRPSMDSVNSMASKRSSMEKPARVGKPHRNSIGRQPSIRRSAMIQSSTAAHIRSRSPSIGSLGSGNYIPKPPFPVPTRSSSRNKPVSKSEGSQSPTPRNSGSYPGRRPYGVKHQRKDSIRKVRSAAPVTRASRPRSRSPTLPATPSNADTYSIPPLPSDIISASGYRHRHQMSTATAATGQSGTSTSISQTSVVDAIAAAMIGEFMWKYVRKRKAFGGPESPADARAAEEASLANHGVRHRRWVWISPYERAILWSSKQPTTGSALMGKSGRKLIIQSVLDVADTCPPPKNETLFNRSILILTPARALKFTTTSRDRHYLWLTALSFLAHSSSPMPDLAALPPIPPPVEELEQRQQGATLRRSRVQDSVRLAKGKVNPVMARYAAQEEPVPSLPSLAGFDVAVVDSASPPTIRRGPNHGRKRSSTGPSAPPPSIPFRSFSHQHVPSVYSNVSSDMYSAGMPPSAPSSVYNPNSGIVSSRTSEASTSTNRHFFEAMGTVRMEAFIDNALGDQKVGYGVRAPHMHHRRRRGSSQWSASTRDASNRNGGVFDFDTCDPFRGF